MELKVSPEELSVKVDPEDIKVASEGILRACGLGVESESPKPDNLDYLDYSVEKPTLGPATNEEIPRLARREAVKSAGIAPGPVVDVFMDGYEAGKAIGDAAWGPRKPHL